MIHPWPKWRAVDNKLKLLRLHRYNIDTMDGQPHDAQPTPLPHPSAPLGTLPNDQGNASAPLGTVRNQDLDASASFGSVPHLDSTRSEALPHLFQTPPTSPISPSEDFETLPNEQGNASAPFGTVRKDEGPTSEAFGTLPHAGDNRSVVLPHLIVPPAENLPHRAPSPASNLSQPATRPLVATIDMRTAPFCIDQHADFTITVREAARIFEESGAPRTERAITNWCNRNARGITRLDCCYDESERKYYISAESIQRVITEERKKNQYLDYREGQLRSLEAQELADQIRQDQGETLTAATPATAPTAATTPPHEDTHTPKAELPHPSASLRNEAETPEGPASSPDERAELKELRMQNFELRVQLEGQKYLIRQFDSLVAGERDRHEREKLALVDRLTDARHQIGSLEQQLLQISAPQGPTRDLS